ncbi:high affinity cationic amino acid transporter 1-like [Tubulanus polymorphus]|uniref:high affinity cationic amino acid transporter 1-like n=1 Tax=Tubulanus polymorphus TaxID=672921 RepID=UPI003DA529C2
MAVTEALKSFWKGITRTKQLDTSHIQETELKRCLGVVELTCLGIGSTLGSGVYVLTGQVAKEQAGPAVVLSFLIAAVASLLAGLCYAEFAARVPKAGSAYVYCYVSMGELWAFVIGWNMILENMIGAASVGKAWSQYFDTLLNDTVANYVKHHLPPMNAPGLSEYPDFVALALLVISTIIVAVGVKMSSLFNFICTFINVIVIGCIICIGLFHVHGENWTSPPGFFPFGFRGVMSGAATCFYAFVGFDTIATSGEEAKEPSKNIPLAILATLVICFVAYFGVSAVITLMIPYFELSSTAPLPKVFAQTGVFGAEYVIAIGGMCGLVAAMMGSIFPLPRIIYSMAKDGLVFRFLAYVNPTTSTPFIATLVAGFLAALLATLLELQSLIEMMSIGTLMAYTVVAVSVLILRYQPTDVGLNKDVIKTQDEIRSDLGDSSLATDSTAATTQQQQGANGESTGLLRVGDKINVVKYVPSTQTSVFRRLPTGDSQDGPNGQTNGERNKEVVAEEIRERSIDYTDQEDAPIGSTYQRIGSEQSVNSLTSLFHVGDGVDEPTEKSRHRVLLSLAAITVVALALTSLSLYGTQYLQEARWWAILLAVLFIAAVLGIIAYIARQPKNRARLIFKVPFVPVLPLASLIVDLYLMLSLSSATWIRFAVWMFFGFLIYFGYGIWKSDERKPDEMEVVLYDVSDNDGIMNEKHKK